MRPSLLLVCAAAIATGCVNTTYPIIDGGDFAEIRARAPLLADEHLLDSPAKDASILGQILREPYDPARPLAEQLAPNPCADALLDVEPRPLEAEVEDAAPLSPPADNRSPASHRYYRFHVLQRFEKAETKAYAACCAKASCGVGYVRGLSFAEGEIALARPTAPGGHANVALDDDGHPLELTLLERQKARGYLSFALATASAKPREERAEPLPHPASEDELLEVRERPKNPDLFRICTKSECITENEFVRRYRKRTHSHELDDFERDRLADVRWMGGLMFGGLGAVCTTLGAVQIASAKKEHEQDKHDKTQIAGGIITGLGVGILTMAAALLVVPPDGETNEHFLTKSQTRRFVERYNRALRGEK